MSIYFKIIKPYGHTGKEKVQDGSCKGRSIIGTVTKGSNNQGCSHNYRSRFYVPINFNTISIFEFLAAF